MSGLSAGSAPVKAYVETTRKTSPFQVIKSAVVSAGVAVFNLTDDGTSGGNALFAEVFTDSVQVAINDALTAYQMSWAFTNSNKTLTVTVNKLTTVNLVSGILGQAPANGATIKVTVTGL
jgi:hypothetical protein